MDYKNKTGLIEVAPGVWAMILSMISATTGSGPNGGFILAGDKVVVIDSFISLGAAREMLAGIKKAGGKAPTYLIDTHSHSDHVIGNQIFSPPAIVISQENTRQAIKKEGDAGIKRTAETRPLLAEDLKMAKTVVPELTFRNALTLYFPGRTVQLMHLGPAHSLGDAIVYIPEEKVLFAGDLFFNHIIPPIMGSSKGWIRSINEIEKMDIKVIVPGHGFIGNLDDLEELKKFFLRLRREVKKCFDRKLPADKVISEIDMGPYEDWPHKDRLTTDVATLYREFGAA